MSTPTPITGKIAPVQSTVASNSASSTPTATPAAASATTTTATVTMTQTSTVTPATSGAPATPGAPAASTAVAASSTVTTPPTTPTPAVIGPLPASKTITITFVPDWNQEDIKSPMRAASLCVLLGPANTLPQQAQWCLEFNLFSDSKIRGLDKEKNEEAITKGQRALLWYDGKAFPKYKHCITLSKTRLPSNDTLKTHSVVLRTHGEERETNALVWQRRTPVQNGRKDLSCLKVVAGHHYYLNITFSAGSEIAKLVGSESWRPIVYLKTKRLKKGIDEIQSSRLFTNFTTNWAQGIEPNVDERELKFAADALQLEAEEDAGIIATVQNPNTIPNANDEPEEDNSVEEHTPFILEDADYIPDEASLPTVPGGPKAAAPSAASAPVVKAAKMRRVAVSKDEPGSDIDLVFIVDATVSMKPAIEMVQKTIEQILKDIAKFPHCASLRYSLVEYRDHADGYPWVLKHTVPFTENLQEMLQGVSGVKAEAAASPGNDTPEAMTDGLSGLARLNWRKNAAKTAIVISDAPPHGVVSNGLDDHPNGCPCGESWKEQVATLRESGIVTHTIQCITPGAVDTRTVQHVEQVLKYVAKQTRGQFFSASESVKELPALITGLADRELEQMRVSRQVLRIMQEKGVSESLLQIKNEDNRAAALYTELTMRDVQTGVVNPATGELEGQTIGMMDFAGAIATLRRMNAWDGRIANVLFPTWKGPFNRVAGLFAKSDNKEVIVPLTAVDVQVDVQQGSVCEVTVVQTFENTTKDIMDATYKFPLDSTAAVTGFVAEVDGDKIVAECMRKEKAQAAYNEALKSGDGGFLLKQQKGHQFEMNVGNLEPGMKAVIRLTYVQLLEPRVSKSATHVDRLLLPTTLAPFLPERTKKDLQVFGKAKAAETSSADSYSLDISMNIEMLQPLLAIESPSHAIHMIRHPQDNKRATVKLSGERTALDRDLIIDLKTEQPNVRPGSFFVMEKWQKPSFEDKNSKEVVDLKKVKEQASTSASKSVESDLEPGAPVPTASPASAAAPAKVIKPSLKQKEIDTKNKDNKQINDVKEDKDVKQSKDDKQSKDSTSKSTPVQPNWVGVQATFKPVFNGATNKWIIQDPKAAGIVATPSSASMPASASSLAVVLSPASSPMKLDSKTTGESTKLEAPRIDTKANGERAKLKLRVLCDVSNSLSGDAATRVREGIEYIKTKQFPSDADVAMYEFGSDAKLVYSNGAKNQAELEQFVGFHTLEDASKPALNSAKATGDGTQLLRIMKAVTKDATKENPVAILLKTDGRLTRVADILTLLKSKKNAVELYIIGVGYTMQHATLRLLVSAVSTGAIEFCHPTESMKDKINDHMERMLLGLREISITWGEVTNAHDEVVDKEDLKPLISPPSLSCILSGEPVSSFGLLPPGHKSTVTMRATSWTGILYKWDLKVDTTHPDIRHGHRLPQIVGHALIEDWTNLSDLTRKKALKKRILDLSVTMNVSSTETAFFGRHILSQARRELNKNAQGTKQITNVRPQAAKRTDSNVVSKSVGQVHYVSPPTAAVMSVSTSSNYVPNSLATAASAGTGTGYFAAPSAASIASNFATKASSYQQALSPMTPHLFPLQTRSDIPVEWPEVEAAINSKPLASIVLPSLESKPFNTDFPLDSSIERFVGPDESVLALAVGVIESMARGIATDSKSQHCDVAKHLLNFFSAVSQLPGWQHVQNYIHNPQLYIERTKSAQKGDEVAAPAFNRTLIAEGSMDDLQLKGQKLIRRICQRMDWLLDLQRKANKSFDPEFYVKVIAADRAWAEDASSFMKEAETKVTDMLSKNPQKFHAFRELQRKGVQWPHSAALRREIERAGFVFRPMMIKRDRCVCETCGVEVSGWKPWHNAWSFHNYAKHPPSFQPGVAVTLMPPNSPFVTQMVTECNMRRGAGTASTSTAASTVAASAPSSTSTAVASATSTVVAHAPSTSTAVATAATSSVAATVASSTTSGVNASTSLAASAAIAPGTAPIPTLTSFSDSQQASHGLLSGKEDDATIESPSEEATTASATGTVSKKKARAKK
jgi:hypothetical protein